MIISSLLFVKNYSSKNNSVFYKEEVENVKLVSKNNPRLKEKVVTSCIRITRSNFKDPDLKAKDIINVDDKNYIVLHIISIKITNRVKFRIEYKVVVQDLNINVRLFDKVDPYEDIFEKTYTIKVGEFFKCDKSMQLTVVDTPEGDFTFTYVLDQVKSTRVKYPDIYVIAKYKYVHIVNQDEINSILYKEKIKKFTLI